MFKPSLPHLGEDAAEVLEMYHVGRHKLLHGRRHLEELGKNHTEEQLVNQPSYKVLQT